jgi:uncharacterized membrane protein YgcG
MTTSLIFMLLMQQLPSTSFLVSTKAGLVNYVEGAASVKAATSIPAGEIVRTGPGGAVEILLNPGSYLRMGENSKVVLDRVELSDIAIRILEGSMVITSKGFDKELPLNVTTGNLKIDIIKDGIYLFDQGKVVVVDGKIRDAGNGLVYGKNYKISDDQGYRAQKVKTFTTGLELWSQKRDETISRANLNVARTLRSTPGLPIGSLLDVWLFYPPFGSFIYMPGARYRSPYGYSYQAAGDIPAYYGLSSGNGSGGNSTSNSGNTGGSNTSSSGGFSGGGGGYSGGGGGVGPAVASPAPPVVRGEVPGGRPKVD